MPAIFLVRYLRKQNPEDVLLCDSFNAEQRSAYDEIMATVYSKQGGLFFVDGPSGTGKTHYNTMYLCRHFLLSAKGTFADT